MKRKILKLLSTGCVCCVCASLTGSTAALFTVITPVSVHAESISTQGANTSRVVDYILPDSSNRIIDPSEIGDFSINDMQMAINEIYARHGRKFQNKGIQDYFNGKSWYSGTVEPDDFDESVLSDIERQNIDTLSYWMQPELTHSNPTTVDKYDYGVDATKSSGQNDTSENPYKYLEGTYSNADTGVAFTLEIYDQPSPIAEGSINYSIGTADIDWGNGYGAEFCLSYYEGSDYYLISSQLGKGKETTRLYNTGENELTATFPFASEYNGVYSKQ